MQSKSLRKLIRRVQFAKLVARHPRYTKAAYRLIREPKATDPLTLGGLAGSPILASMLDSSLMWTGNGDVPLLIAQNLYLNGQRDQALSVLRRTPDRDARMMEGELLLYSGKLAKAKSIFSAAADRSATKATALRQVATCHYLEGNMDAAIDTIIVAAAMYPRIMPLMTLFSRIVRTSDEIERYLKEKMRIAKHGLSAGTSAQLVRACGRAGAKDKAEAIASDAIINICASQGKQQYFSVVGNAPVEDLPSVGTAMKGPTAECKSTNHNASGVLKGQFSSEKGDIILEHISDVAKGAGIRLFLMGGTLLGLIRDRQLLSWDKDLDFGCFAEEVSISDLWQIFLDNPYFIPLGVVEDRLIKLRHISGVTVDIFVNFLEDGVRWHGGQFVFWRDDAFALKQITLRDRPFHIPENPEAYLANHYGMGWRAPDPHFDVFWEAPDAFNPNVEHRYANTLAKGIQFLTAGSPEVIAMRRYRAKNGGADDVEAAYQFVLGVYDEFRTQ